MRIFSTLLLLGALSLFALPSLAQTAAELKARAAEQEVEHQELLNLEQETVRALQWNAPTFFRRVYSEDFIATSPSGRTMDKQAFLSAVENSNAKYSSFIASDVRVRIFQDTAIVTCLWSARGSRDGHSFSRQSRVIHVYIHGQRGWIGIASQETLLPG
jgi:ketosteroid isomerase-like protein